MRRYGPLLLLLALGFWAVWPTSGQEREGEDPGAEELTPEAQAAQRAAEREKWRLIRLDAKAKEAGHEARREEESETAPRVAQPVELRNPLPLPVEVRNPAALAAPGKPAGAVCPGSQSCVLRFTAAVREVLVVTAVWSAAKVQCDELTTASPANGAVIAPWWRCEHQLVVEGPGAGYAGFVIIK